VKVLSYSSKERLVVPREVTLTLSIQEQSARPVWHETPICRSAYRVHRAKTGATASSQGSSVSMCLGVQERDARSSYCPATPTHQPSTGLGRGRSPDVGALWTPAGAPQRRVPLPHQALHHSSFFFSPFPEFKVLILTSFFTVIQ